MFDKKRPALESRPPEPPTVRETQLLLKNNGYSECTEMNAKFALFMRGLVREGKVSDRDG